MKAVKATHHFETWLGQHTPLLKKDLQAKHAAMKSAPFPFLRATFYRWAQLWPQTCPHLASGPCVLAVGDLHVENFGTWRDAEGRLIWGINDFDEAHRLAYSNDLVRLAVSARLACEAGHLHLKAQDICDSILEGYQKSLSEGGLPYVLGEKHQWLRQIAESDLRDPVRFWAKIDALPTVKDDVPLTAIDAIEILMPTLGLRYRVAHRGAGLGNLGHERYVAIANWNGARIAREAKALAPSACNWAEDQLKPTDILYQAIMSRSIRCPDPFVQLRGRWVVRRLSPHCSRIEMADLKAHGAELQLLHAMGWETANVHLGTPTARKAILRDLQKHPKNWLSQATEKMWKVVRADWKTWARHGYE